MDRFDGWMGRMWVRAGRPGMTHKSLVAITVASLLIASVGIVAPGRPVALATGIPTVYVAASGADGAGANCADPDFGPDSHATGVEGALEAAVSAATAGSVIHLCAGTFSLTSGEVAVTKNDLTFEGDSAASSGDTIVDGGSLIRLFDATAASIVTFRNLTLANGNAVGQGDQYGGAVRSRSVALQGVTLTGNQAQQGGAVFAEGNVTIARTTFAGNTASGSGGAVYQYTDTAARTLSVANSTFFENSAGVGGSGRAGAIFSNALTPATATIAYDITSSTFAGNGGTIYAGTLAFAFSLATGTVQDSLFSGEAPPAGLACDIPTPTEIGTNLSEDIATGCPGTSKTAAELDLQPLAGDGSPTPTVALGGSSVARDATTGIAGDGVCALPTDQRGIARPQGAGCDIGAYEVDVRRFVKPTSGDAWTYCPYAYTAVADAVVAASAGNTIHLCAGTHTLTGSTYGDAVATGLADLTIEGDSSTSTIVEGDGTFRLFNLSASPSVTTFRNLTIRGGKSASGGAVYAGGSVVARSVRLVDNVAVNGYGGSGLSGEAGAIRANATLSLVGVFASGNVGGAGGVAWAGSTMSIADSRFERNGSGSVGGVYYGPAPVTISDSSFVENTANTGGGAISASTVTVVRSTFTANYTTTGNGGAIKASSVTATSSDFASNIAGSEGGAIFTSGGSGVTVLGGTFDQNDAGTDGGAILTGAISVTDATFTGNNAGDEGGAIYAGGVVDLSSATFTGNTAVGNGGAVIQSSSSDPVTVRESTFSANASDADGGGIYVANPAPISIWASTFDSNSADGGGAVYGDGSLASVLNSTFYENTANTGDGGAFNVDRLDVTHGTFVRNSTLSGAGGNVIAAEMDARASIFAGGTCSVPSYLGDYSNARIYDSRSCGVGSTKTNLNLGSLGDWGGPTATVPLISPSQAIDFIAPVDCPLSVDQRGQSRPAVSGCDAGAYEWVPTGISGQIYLRGGSVSNGKPTPTAGDTIDLRVWVAATSGYEPTQGTVSFFLCGVADCLSGTPIGGPVALTDGTSGSDHIAEAWLHAWAPELGWRFGTYVIRALFEPAAGTVDGPATEASAATQSIVIGNLDYYVGDGSATSGDCRTPDFSSGGDPLTGTLIGEALAAAAVDGEAFNTIHLCPGTYAFADEVWFETGDSTTGIEIVGEGAARGDVILDATGGGANRHFSFDNDSAVTFRNLTLTNGERGGNDGGSVRSYFFGSLLLDHVDVTSNTCTDCDGGAVYAAGPLIVRHSTFANNRTTGAWDGGAIAAYGGIEVLASTFTANTAYRGGAIMVTGSAGSLASITDGTFIGNSVATAGSSTQSKGGAIEASIPLTVHGGEFSGNTSAEHGGAIFAWNTVEISSDASFSDNTATKYGGAVYATEPIAISDATFAGNVASGGASPRGGAIYATKGVALVGTDFSSNSSASGGAIYGMQSVSVSDATFTANVGSSAGGAIFGQGALSVSDGIFEGNSSTTVGGAIYVAGTPPGSEVRIEGGRFVGNSAVGLTDAHGGAVYVYGQLQLIGTDFTANSANRGGAVHVWGDLTVSGGSFVDNTTVTSNGGSPKDGGAMFVQGAVAISDGTAFIGNQARDGGAIALDLGTSAISSSDGVYVGNVASRNGGAIYTYDQPFTSTRDHFASNVAATWGGAIEAGTAGVTSTLGRYEDNRADVGGAIYAAEVTSDTDTFLSNSSGDAGGAISAGGPIVVSGGTFTGNSAGGDGGALGGGTVTVTNHASFSDNTSGARGGAILAGTGGIAVSDATFVANRSVGPAGAIYIAGSSTLERVTFRENSAGSYGGAVATDPGSIALVAIDVEFSANTASDLGGAIRGGSGGVITVFSSTFDANTAVNEGGAIYGDAVEVTNGTFVDNSAGSTGGAIGASTATLTHATLKDNVAPAGSGVAVGTLAAYFSLFAGDTCDWSSVVAESTGNVTTHASCPGTTVTSGALNLGSLADNGGATKTIALPLGSAAIDPATDGVDTVLVDQRGLPRPKGLRGDAGAFERQTTSGVTIYGPASLMEDDEAAFRVALSSGDEEITGGTIALSDGTRPIGSCEVTAGSGGVCDFTTNTLGTGVRRITATYSGTSGDFQRDPGVGYLDVTVTIKPKATYYVTSPIAPLGIAAAGKGGITPLLSDCTSGNFTDIQAALDFAASDGLFTNTVHICPGTYDITTGLTIVTGDTTAGLTIEGDRSTNTFLVGDGSVRIFDVNSTTEELFLTIRELALRNGAVTDADGAALNWGTGGGRLVIESSELTGNTIADGGGGGGFGGAVYAGVGITVVNSRFAHNTAVGKGGALYAGADFTSDSSVFVSNEATEDGGAVYAAGNVVSDPSLYQGNSSGMNGGAIYAEGTLTTIGDTFVDNRATLNGGAIYAVGGVVAESASFTENSSGISGGAVYGVATVSISDGSSFADNTANTGDGGAVYGQGGVSVTDATFTDNSTGVKGGAVAATAPVVLLRVEFSSNTAATGDGGAIWSRTVSGVDVDFIDNSAGSYGGAIAYLDNSIVAIDLTTSTFVINRAAVGGGAIGVSSGLDIAVTLDRVDFTSNSALASNGGAILISENVEASTSSLTIRGGRYDGNVAAADGGAIWAGGSGNGTTPLVVEQASFTGNQGIVGGAIFGNGTVDVDASTLAENSAGTQGGGIFAESIVTVVNSTFVENTAGSSGAAIVSTGSSIGTSQVDLAYVTFKDNTSGNGVLVNVLTMNASQTIFQGGLCTATLGTPGTANFRTEAPGTDDCPGTSVTTGDLKLGQLQDNGGPTLTVAPGVGSIAVEPEFGETAPCTVDVDQRGVARPLGWICDSGAYERPVTRTILELLDNPINYGADSPRFRVTVTTGDGGPVVVGGFITLYELSTGTHRRIYGTCDLTSGTGGTCDFTTGIPRLDYFVGRHPLLAEYSGTTGDQEFDPSSSTGDQYVVRNGVALLYTGQTYFVPAPSNGKYPLQATLTPLSGGTICENKEVGFYLGASDGTYPTLIGKAMTNGSGVAQTDGTLSTGINEILVRFEGNGACEPAVNTATILSDVSGGTSSGGGHYTVPGVGKVNVAYQLSMGSYKLRGVDYTTLTGNLTWHTNGKFRMKGTITGYTKLSSCPSGLTNTPICAYVTGFGTLSMWLSLTDGTSRWVPIATGVGFQATVGDGGQPPTKGNGNGNGNGKGGGGSNAKTYTDWFRMNIPTAVVLGETLDLRDLKGGNLVVN